MRIFTKQNLHFMKNFSPYQDDGVSYEFRKGTYLRVEFRCVLAPDGSLSVSIKRQGASKPWWHSIRVEVVGWQPQQFRLDAYGRVSSLEQTPLGWAGTFAADGESESLTLR
jgi:Domain of unknown function (DUF5110)